MNKAVIQKKNVLIARMLGWKEMEIVNGSPLYSIPADHHAQILNPYELTGPVCTADSLCFESNPKWQAILMQFLYTCNLVGYFKIEMCDSHPNHEGYPYTKVNITSRIKQIRKHYIIIAGDRDYMTAIFVAASQFAEQYLKHVKKI
ncbi:hypothetical protein PV783_34130 [Chitinophaga sp. CC14]|uniref:hypothetical protein n=1 Tax=Chitinophaga sp. CC14 TaxID=3029199 RepID=UPI003B78AE3C